MKIFKTVLIIGCFYLAFSPSVVSPQSAEKPKDKSLSTWTKGKGTNNRKVEPGDYFSKNEIKSPFRYVIVDDDLQFNDSDEGKDKVPVRHYLKVLMEEQAFNKANLIYLFKYLSNFYTDPFYLDVEVHTSLMTVETPEESAAMSTHSSRDGFRQFHKTATYTRNTDIYERCYAGFLYDTGKPGNFVVKYVKLTCLTKK